MSEITTPSIPDPTLPRYIWGDKQIKEARALLNLRFCDILPDHLMQKLRDGALVSQEERQQVYEAVQEMLSYLIQKYRNDPRQIERAITQFFKGKKK